jgi:hypothetical protein
MALTIADILEASAPAVIQLMERFYKLEPPFKPTEDIHAAYLLDPASGTKLVITWAQSDEDRQQTTNDKILLVRALLLNAVETMDDLLKELKEEV